MIKPYKTDKYILKGKNLFEKVYTSKEYIYELRYSIDTIREWIGSNRETVEHTIDKINEELKTIQNAKNRYKNLFLLKKFKKMYKRKQYSLLYNLYVHEYCPDGNSLSWYNNIDSVMFKFNLELGHPFKLYKDFDFIKLPNLDNLSEKQKAKSIITWLKYELKLTNNKNIFNVKEG